MDLINNKNSEKEFCERVLTINQLGPDCWFLAILMAVLYSRRSRKLLLKIADKWDSKIKIYNIIKYIITHKYFKTDNIIKDYEYFNMVNPYTLLKQLNKYNSSKYEFKPNKKKGYFSECYIKKIYDFLQVKNLFLDYNENKKTINYSLYNNYMSDVVNLADNKAIVKFKLLTKDKLIEEFNNNKNPDVIIININEGINNILDTYKHYSLSNYLSDTNINNLTSLNDNIIFNENEYVLDSVILSNFNVDHLKIGHSIAGITCKSKRYVYNGWTKYTMNDNNLNREKLNNMGEIPCELMPFDWDIKKDSEFCLNVKKCIPDTLNVDKNELCFSFNKGKRIIVYVKKNLMSSSKSSLSSSSSSKSLITSIVKNCPKGKILNPLTKRCVNIKGSTSKKLKIVDIKECPEGKVLNPLTKRCVNINGATFKKLDLTLKSKSKPKPNPNNKKCPEGKILNPKTNRCININGAISKKLKLDIKYQK